jgi:hypothetical protein
MGDTELQRAVERLPIPPVGVPWFQLRPLPDALVLAHAIGHHVENDFDLTPTLRELADAALTFAAAPRERRHQ